MKEKIIHTIFTLFIISFLIQASENDSSVLIYEEDDTLVVESEPEIIVITVRETLYTEPTVTIPPWDPCTSAFATWSKKYNPKIPLFEEFGCRNKCKAKHMIIRSLRAPIMSMFVGATEGYHNGKFSEDAIVGGIIYLAGGAIIGIPVSLLSGYFFGKYYEEKRVTDPDFYFRRPRIEVSFSPPLALTLEFNITRATISYRFFNQDWKGPDIISIGGALQEYYYYNREPTNINAEIRKAFVAIHWRVTNLRFFNYFVGVRSGYAWGKGYKNNAAGFEQFKVSIPYLQLFQNVKFNLLDISYVSFEGSYELVGPYFKFKDYDKNYPYMKNFRIEMAFGAFIF